MPWSPLKYTNQIFEGLRKEGYVEQVTTEALHTAIMKETKLIRPQTIAQVVKAFERLGYIEPVGNNIWKIKYGGER
jgi:hypothetical protein